MRPKERDYRSTLGADGSMGLDRDIQPPRRSAQRDPGQLSPYSFQVLQRLHQDATNLLSEYEEMRGPLEGPPEIGEAIERKLQALVGELDVLEALATQHHPDEVFPGY
jgi:hypothetical protein